MKNKSTVVYICSTLFFRSQRHRTLWYLSISRTASIVSFRQGAGPYVLGSRRHESEAEVECYAAILADS